MLKCGIPLLAVVLAILIFCTSGQRQAVSRDKTIIDPISPNSNRITPEKNTKINEKEEIAPKKKTNVEEKPKETDKPIRVAISPKELIDAQPATNLASEEIKTPPGPQTVFVVPTSEKEEYSGPVTTSSGVDGDSSKIYNMSQLEAIEAGKVPTTTVQIALLRHDFTNYQKHEAVLNSYRNWLSKNTLLRDEDKVQLLGLTERVDSETGETAPYLIPEKMASTTLLFMTGDDADVVLLSSNEHTGLRQGCKGVRDSFNESERTALKKYVENGGTLFFNYGKGEGKFSEKVRCELEKIFGRKLVVIPTKNEIYTIENNLSTIPHLKGLEVDGRIAVIFSESDILGQRQFQFLTNVLYYALKYR
jgi:hypothetical protein